MEKVNWKVEGMSCTNCALTIDKYLQGRGMQQVKVNFMGGDVSFESDTQIPKQEIAKAEKDFEKMAAEKGVPEAFAFYADENATIRRENDTLVTGRENIRKYYEQPSRKNAKVSWTADHIDASGSGDMGYTYGKYSWQSTDSTGKTNEFKGIFSTVWKKQGDGSWKYVWD